MLTRPLAGARIANEALLSAVRALAWFKSREGGPLRRVDFGNLGADELGSIYESLLELIPHYDPDNRTYTLTVLPGNERKESGAYYTPTSLVERLLDSALDPLLDEATAKGTPEEKVASLLDLTVCDPACGSGHFLVAAARRIAKRIAAEETNEAEPPEPEIRKALRRVVAASTVSTSTRWPRSWPVSRCLWKPSNPASRWRTSTRTFESATPSWA